MHNNGKPVCIGKFWRGMSAYCKGLFNEFLDFKLWFNIIGYHTNLTIKDRSLCSEKLQIYVSFF